jgi:hypothetical protein
MNLCVNYSLFILSIKKPPQSRGFKLRGIVDDVRTGIQKLDGCILVPDLDSKK